MTETIYLISASSGVTYVPESIRHAGDIILSDDNHYWEIIQDEEDGPFWLWRSDRGGMVCNPFHSWAPDVSEAEYDILSQVVRHADDYGFNVLPDDAISELFRADLIAACIRMTASLA